MSRRTEPSNQGRDVLAGAGQRPESGHFETFIGNDLPVVLNIKTTLRGVLWLTTHAPRG